MVVVVLAIARIASGEKILWIWSRQEQEEVSVASHDAQLPATDGKTDWTPRRYFRCGWGQMQLPILGRVAIIDRGNPGVGLSAMQMDALGVGRGKVLLRFGNRTCEAKVWNACGPAAIRGGHDRIRITQGAARKLGCTLEDEIEFVQVLVHNLPVEV